MDNGHPFSLWNNTILKYNEINYDISSYLNLKVIQNMMEWTVVSCSVAVCSACHLQLY